MDTLEYKQELIKIAEEDFGYLEDGYVYYFPTKRINQLGALQSHDLRIIADELDARNQARDEEVKRMLEEAAGEDLEDPLILHGDKPKGKLILILLSMAFWIIIIASLILISMIKKP